MPKITYIEHDGTVHDVVAEVGESVMRAAVDNTVPGIDADCGGACSCATCHVMVDAAWAARVGPLEAGEETMLGVVPERHANSRLSCQIVVTQELDGLVVHLPEFQM